MSVHFQLFPQFSQKTRFVSSLDGEEVYYGKDSNHLHTHYEKGITPTANTR